MTKITDKDEPVISEDAVCTKLVFSDDALVVDYLNNLLASAPTTNPDSGVIHFVHMPTWDRRKSTGTANAFVNKAALLSGTEHLTIEANGLRKENENLKFKTELAEIDAQVLRGENHNLKMELASLAAQRKELKSSLDSILAQNNDLLLRMNSLQSQLELSERKSKEVLSQAHEDSAPIMVTVAENRVVPVSETPLPCDNLDPVTENKEEPPFDLAPQQEIITPEIIPEIPLAAVTIDQEQPLDDNRCSGIAQDTAFISRAQSSSRPEGQRAEHNTTVFSRRAVAIDPIDRSAKPSSKIIKQNHAKENLGVQDADQASEITPQNSSHHNKISKDTDRKLDFVQQQHTEDSVITQEDNPLTNMETHRVFDADEIDLEPATAPKVIVLKHMKNYVDLQKETDPTSTAKAGHAIIL